MSNTKQLLLFLGIILFLAGLLSGLVVMEMPNSRMGLAAHLEGVMNGMFLLIVGLAWQRMAFSPVQEKLAFWLLVYGTYANFFIIQSASILGTSKMTPIAGKGYTGTEFAEILINIGLVTVALSMIVSICLIAFGLYKYNENEL